MAAQVSAKGRNTAVRIAPTAIPANMNVTAVGRSYLGGVRISVAMLFNADSYNCGRTYSAYNVGSMLSIWMVLLFK
jgi:hypothetical protein